MDCTNEVNKKTKTQNRQKKSEVVNLSRQAAGSNWQNALLNKEKTLSKNTDDSVKNKLKSSLQKLKAIEINNINVSEPKLIENNLKCDNDNNNVVETQPKKKRKPRAPKNMKFVAMDCEMVGVGPSGIEDMLARVSIVNRNGDILLDKYVKPQEMVIDYRTKVSGIRPADMESGEDFRKVQKEVLELIKDKILIGHAIKHDLKVLYINHPYSLIRDTSSYRPLSKIVSNGATPSLKRVAKVVLNMDIQKGEHSSVEDARAAMQIYNRLHIEWEKYIQRKNHHFNGLTAKEYKKY